MKNDVGQRGDRGDCKRKSADLKFGKRNLTGLPGGCCICESENLDLSLLMMVVLGAFESGDLSCCLQLLESRRVVTGLNLGQVDVVTAGRPPPS